mgnify:CR=1 FL=1|tara:strand:+ start:562 stop:804 length:243 start_codon:yes stop_codon:yes gene_type:complete
MNIKHAVNAENDGALLLFGAVFLAFHIAVSCITISGHGLSFITVFGAPAIFFFYCTLFQPVIVIALIALITLYHIAPSKN